MRPYLLTVAFCATLACSRDTASRAASYVSSTTSSGVPSIHNQGIGRWTKAQRWEVRLVTRIDPTAGGKLEVGEPWDLVADRRGRIYALFARLGQVRVFEPSGTYLRTIGRPGRGPGDLSFPAKLTLDSLDQLWIQEEGTKRWSVFDTSGAYVTSYARNMSWGCRPIRCGWMTPGGTLIDGYMDLRNSGMWDNVVSCRRAPACDTVSVSLSREPRSEALPAVHPYSPRRLLAFAPPAFLWLGFTDHWDFVRLSLQGDTTLTTARATTGPVLTDEDRRDLALALQWFKRETGVPAPEALTSLPTTKPPIAQLATSPDGYLWVFRTGPSDGSSQEVDLVAPDGVFDGTIHLPVGIATDAVAAPPLDPSPILVLSDKVVAAVRDDEGTSLVILAIRRPF